MDRERSFAILLIRHSNSAKDDFPNDHLVAEQSTTPACAAAAMSIAIIHAA